MILFQIFIKKIKIKINVLTQKLTCSIRIPNLESGASYNYGSVFSIDLKNKILFIRIHLFFFSLIGVTTNFKLSPCVGITTSILNDFKSIQGFIVYMNNGVFFSFLIAYRPFHFFCPLPFFLISNLLFFFQFFSQIFFNNYY